MTSRFLNSGETKRREYPTISNETLLYLGGIVGLTPSFRGGKSGLPLAKAAEALQPELAPDFEADAERIERELSASENI